MHGLRGPIKLVKSLFVRERDMIKLSVAAMRPVTGHKMSRHHAEELCLRGCAGC